MIVVMVTCIYLMTSSVQSTPEIKTESVADDDDEGSGKRPRAKSAVRRKPREQRKPTGIIQFDVSIITVNELSLPHSLSPCL